MKDAVRVHLHSVILLVKFAAVHGKRAVEHAHAAAAEIPAGLAAAPIRSHTVAGHGSAVHGKRAAVHIHRAAAVIQGERFILVSRIGAVAADDAAVHHERAAVHIHRAALGVELAGILGAGGVVLIRRCCIGRIIGKGSAVHGEYRILRHIHRVAEVGLIAGDIAAVQVDLGIFRHPDRAAVIVDFLRCVVVHRLSSAAGDLSGADAVADVQRAALHMDAAVVYRIELQRIPVQAEIDVAPDIELCVLACTNILCQAVMPTRQDRAVILIPNLGPVGDLLPLHAAVRCVMGAVRAADGVAARLVADLPAVQLAAFGLISLIARGGGQIAAAVSVAHVVRPSAGKYAVGPFQRTVLIFDVDNGGFFGRVAQRMLDIQRLADLEGRAAHRAVKIDVAAGVDIARGAAVEVDGGVLRRIGPPDLAAVLHGELGAGFSQGDAAQHSGVMYGDLGSPRGVGIKQLSAVHVDHGTLRQPHAVQTVGFIR